MTQQALKQKPKSVSEQKTIHLFIAGTGAVGGTLVNQLTELNAAFNFCIIGGCNSKTFFIDKFGASPDEALQKIYQGHSTNWDIILKQLTIQSVKRPIFVDATGSEEVARLYPKILNAGFSIITPSKLANTFDQSYYDLLRQITAEQGVHFKYETTVGAGLPIISTLNNLMESGDTITEVSGVVSGTMTYLFNELEKGIPFSEAIVKARELGYAEPDPRDDLSGEDVARKFITIARELDIPVERSQLNVESLIPNELSDVNRETFLEKLTEIDSYWQNKIARAHKKEHTLRYTGKLVNKNITIGIESVPVDSPLGKLSGTDNLLQIFSKRYSKTPIVIQGPGAGKEVTAAGVFFDILEVAKRL
ncbi:MAG: hypothetical protein U5J95_07755 [Balneolaceae bacterium]|nr:hypothetical protein [Balneolaceae bacterium]